MEYSTYRNNGIIRGFKNTGINIYFLGINSEVCLDERLKSKTIGKWFLGHPDIGRLLTEEETSHIIPIIKDAIQWDIEFKKDYLKSVTNNI